MLKLYKQRFPSKQVFLRNLVAPAYLVLHFFSQHIFREISHRLLPQN